MVLLEFFRCVRRAQEFLSGHRFEERFKTPRDNEHGHTAISKIACLATAKVLATNLHTPSSNLAIELRLRFTLDLSMERG